jgi:cholesterol transport system auxiliary component
MNPCRIRALARTGLLASLLTLGGCLLTGTATPVMVFSPVVQIQPQEEWPEVDWQLMVVRPNADQMHDSQRILVRPEASRLQVYGGSTWADSLPDMLHSMLLRAFEDSGRIHAVTRQSSSMRARFGLILDVRAFEAVYDGEPNPAADIQIHAKLVHVPSTRVVAARTFRHWQRSGGTDVSSVVDAFTLGTRAFIDELVGWTLVEGEDAGPKLQEWREERFRERQEERHSREAGEAPRRGDGPSD